MLSESANICGYDLVSEGISLVEYARVGVETLVRSADVLGIEWVVVADGDMEGKKYLQRARAHIGNRPPPEHVHELAFGELDVFLCMEGFGCVYEQNVSHQKRHIITADHGTLEYWCQVIEAQPRNAKPDNAATVIERMRKTGKKGVPKQLREIVTCAINLAREQK